MLFVDDGLLLRVVRDCAGLATPGGFRAMEVAESRARALDFSSFDQPLSVRFRWTLPLCWFCEDSKYFPGWRAKTRSTSFMRFIESGRTSIIYWMSRRTPCRVVATYCPSAVSEYCSSGNGASNRSRSRSQQDQIFNRQTKHTSSSSADLALSHSHHVAWNIYNRC